MRVAYILQSFPALSETFIRSEVIALINAGVQVIPFAFAMGDAEPVPGVEPAILAPTTIARIVTAHIHWLTREPRRYMRVMALAARSRNGISRLFFLKLHWVTALAAAEPDCVHAHFGWRASDLALLVHLMTGRRFTFTTHGSDIFVHPATNYRLKTALAARHFTISDFNKAHLVTTFGLPAERIRVTHCGIDFAALPPARPPDGHSRIVCVGRLVLEKGQDTLIRACAILAEAGVDFQCEIIGEGPERAALEASIRARAMQNHVRLLGCRPHADVLQRLATATLAVLPSRSEGIPVFLMEAMAMRVAVIGPRITGVPELIEDAQSGYLIPPDNPLLLAEKMRMILADGDLRNRFIARAYATVRDDFDCAKTVHPLLDTWHDCLPTDARSRTGA